MSKELEQKLGLDQMATRFDEMTRRERLEHVMAACENLRKNKFASCIHMHIHAVGKQGCSGSGTSMGLAFMLSMGKSTADAQQLATRVFRDELALRIGGKRIKMSAFGKSPYVPPEANVWAVEYELELGS